MTITHVFDTHVHADHRSGGRELARRGGCEVLPARAADVAFPFEPLDDGQRIELGNTLIDVLHTPGHTPESICLVVRTCGAVPSPGSCCTGDTLFVGRRGPAGSARSDREERGGAARQRPRKAAVATGRRSRSSRHTSPAPPAARASAASQLARWPSRSDGTRFSAPTGTRSSRGSRASRSASRKEWRTSSGSTRDADEPRMNRLSGSGCRKPRPVRPAGRGQRLRRCHGGARALHPAGDRRAGVPPRRARRRLSFIVVFGWSRRPRTTSPAASRIASAASGCWWRAGSSRPGAVHAHVGALLELVLAANVLLGSARV